MPTSTGPGLTLNSVSRIAPATVRVLHSSSEIRAAVREVLSDPQGKRIVMVAYVGEGAENYIPFPAGIELICWDKEGSTDPDTIREFLRRKAKVFFASNLHMKVFWAEGRCAVLGSANLSQNGLGDNGLHEVAVLVPAQAIDVDRLRATVGATAVSTRSLRDLDKRTRKYRSRNAGETAYPLVRNRRPRRTFAQWYTIPDRPVWRLLACCEEFEGRPKKVQEKLKSFGHKTDVFAWTGVRSHVQPYEWLLMVDTKNLKRDGVHWACADFAVPLRRTDKGFYDKLSRFFAVQISKTSVYGAVPFNERERPFVSAVCKLLRSEGVRTYAESLKFAPDGILSDWDLKRLYDLYSAETKRI